MPPTWILLYLATAEELPLERIEPSLATVHFQKAARFSWGGARPASMRVPVAAGGAFIIAELATKGPHLVPSQRLCPDENADVVLELWLFSTVGLIDGLPEECGLLAASENSFASCHRMALLLGVTDMLKYMPARISDLRYSG